MSLTQQAIFWEIRLPRVVLGVLVGAMLAVAGTAYQGVFRNPLADPYLLGVSSGAGLGATLGIVAGGGDRPGRHPAAGVRRRPARRRGDVRPRQQRRRRPGRGRHRAGGGRGGRVLQRDPELRAAAVRRLAALGLLLDARPAEHRRLVRRGRSRCPTSSSRAPSILLHRRVLDVMAVGDVEAASLGRRPGAGPAGPGASPPPSAPPRWSASAG